MTMTTPMQPSPPAAAASPADAMAPGAPTQDRIDHLFRGARRAGCIHPLQHLIQRHRLGTAP